MAASPLAYERFLLGPLEVNTWLIHDRNAGEGLVIDPADDSPELVARIRELGLKRLRILLTHGHADHILGVDPLRRALEARVAVAAADASMLGDPRSNLSAFLGTPFAVAPADETLAHGDVVRVGEVEGTVIAVPGHTPGGLAFAFPRFVVTGDALFAGSIGRTDLPGGDGELLVRMIQERLLTRPDATILPGHGPESTLAHERQTNPFLKDDR